MIKPIQNIIDRGQFTRDVLNSELTKICNEFNIQPYLLSTKKNSFQIKPIEISERDKQFISDMEFLSKQMTEYLHEKCALPNHLKIELNDKIHRA